MTRNRPAHIAGDAAAEERRRVKSLICCGLVEASAVEMDRQRVCEDTRSAIYDQQPYLMFGGYGEMSVHVTGD